MKRFRPCCAGYILLYVLTLVSLVDTGHTLYCQIKGIQNALTSFYLFSYIISIMALCYVWLYARAQVAVGEADLRLAFPASIAPREGEPRPMFLYRQGSTDLRFIDKTLRLDTVTAYGYVEDMGYKPIDASQAGPNNKLFPVHEVAFITSENKRYHLNAAIFSKKQRREMFSLIRQRTGVVPTGSLKRELD